MQLSDRQIRRYSRQIILPEIGGKGQKKLLASKVLVVGAGGLGSPVTYYLAAAGVGTLGIIDHDTVDLSNLHRQILHGTPDVGRPKVESAKETLEKLNPDVKIITYQERLSKENVVDLISQYDLVVDAVDNFTARYLLNDACVLVNKPLVEAGVLRWDGMIMTVVPGKGPCYRCVFPTPPAPESAPTCQEAGIIGVTAGVMGVLQATEAVKFLLNTGENLVGRMLIFHALESRFQEVEITRQESCPVCGSEPTITQLEEYTGYCTP
ncbi:MAG: thiazole biosynthesis adenylyltransferase ThiF [Thermoanaerobacteraceae bacterium]|nr:thiazole biosynthesis adenylyltransferase ThiF [Thermoanaerobacteraceae bacterium]